MAKTPKSIATHESYFVAAPWQLTGSGYILIYRFPREFVMSHGFIPDTLKPHFVGGFGAVMLVDYHISNVGAYHELLFIPGMFRVNGKRYFSISRIFVSTQISVDNGRKNWGIPKYQANFQYTQHKNGHTQISVSNNDTPILYCALTSGTLKLPVNTHLSPIHATLIQPFEGQTYLVTPTSKGNISRANLASISVNAEMFPDISQFQPLAAIRARDVRLTFPIAQTPMFGIIT